MPDDREIAREILSGKITVEDAARLRHSTVPAPVIIAPPRGSRHAATGRHVEMPRPKQRLRPSPAARPPIANSPARTAACFPEWAVDHLPARPSSARTADMSKTSPPTPPKFRNTTMPPPCRNSAATRAPSPAALQGSAALAPAARAQRPAGGQRSRNAILPVLRHAPGKRPTDHRCRDDLPRIAAALSRSAARCHHRLQQLDRQPLVRPVEPQAARQPRPAFRRLHAVLDLRLHDLHALHRPARRRLLGNRNLHRHRRQRQTRHPHAA